MQKGKMDIVCGWSRIKSRAGPGAQVSGRVEIPNLEFTVLTADARRAKQAQARRLPFEKGVRD
jgi:hypothetical protein